MLLGALIRGSLRVVGHLGLVEGWPLAVGVEDVVGGGVDEASSPPPRGRRARSRLPIAFTRSKIASSLHPLLGEPHRVEDQLASLRGRTREARVGGVALHRLSSGGKDLGGALGIRASART